MTGSETNAATVQRRVLSGSVWGLASAGISVPLNLAAVAVLSRALGASGFGTYATYMFLLPMVVGLSDLGLGNSFQHRAALAYGQGDVAELRRSAREAFTWALIRAPISLIVGGIVLQDMTALIFFALYVVCVTMTAGAALILLASVRVAEFSRIAIAAALMSTTASVVAALLGAGPATVFAVAVAFQNFPNLLLLRRIEQASGLRRACVTPTVLTRIRQDAGFGFGTFASAQLITLMAARSELLFFTREQAGGRGVYAGAFSAGNRVTIPLDALQGPIGAALVVGASGSADVFGRGFRRALRVDAALFALSVAPALYVSALLSVLIFPRGFTDVALAAVVLAAASIVMSALHPLQSYFFATRRAQATFRAAVIGVVINLALSAVLVPTYGLFGAVAANCLGCLVYATVLAVPVVRSPMRPYVARYAIEILTPLLAASVWCSVIVGDHPTSLRLVIGGVAACVQVFLLARRWPYLTTSDVSLLVQAFPASVSGKGRALLSMLAVRGADAERVPG